MCKGYRIAVSTLEPLKNSYIGEGGRCAPSLSRCILKRDGLSGAAKKECGVAKMDSDGGGTHWVAYQRGCGLLL